MVKKNISSEPLRLVQDAKGTQFLIYSTEKGVKAELRFQDEEPWLTQLQMAEIFGVDVRTANHHVQQFLNDGELDAATIRKFRIVRDEGGRRVEREIEHYGLDVAFYVGYRVNSKQGILFRRWATQILVQFATKGFVVDVERLESPEGRPDFFDELLDKIRHIRASEKRMWTRILELAAFCGDYDPQDQRQHAEFFAEIQNTMHWAITQQTACEVVVDRVNAERQNAGVTHFKGKMPTVDEAKVAKNLMGEAEISALNLITSLTLEFFESQVEQRRPTLLADFLGKMRDLIKLDGRPLKQAGYAGKVSRVQANNWASEQIKMYKEKKRVEMEDSGEKVLRQIAGKLRSKPRKTNE